MNPPQFLQLFKKADALEITESNALASSFDLTFTTSLATTMTFVSDDGIVVTTALGTSHAPIFGAIARTGPHTWRITCAAGLGEITAIDATTDLVISIKNLLKLYNLVSLYINNDAVVFSGAFPSSLTTLYAGDCGANCNIDLALLPRNTFVILQLSGTTYSHGALSALPPMSASLYLTSRGGNITGSCSDIPSGAKTIHIYSTTGITASSIVQLVSVVTFLCYSMGWLTGDTTTGVTGVLCSISDAIHANANHFTYAAAPIALNIGGTNEAPSHLDGFCEPLVAPGSGNSDEHWQWDAVAGKHKAICGGAALWVASHNIGHPWTIVVNGGTAEAIMLGTALTSWATTYPAARIHFGKYPVTAATDGTLGDLRHYAAKSGNIKMAIYDDDGAGGEAGTLLAYSASVAVVAGWNTIPINIQVALTAGNYWIAVKSDTADLIKGQATGGTSSYLDAAYADAFPNPPAGLTSGGTINLALTGYGLVTT